MFEEEPIESQLQRVTGGVSYAVSLLVPYSLSATHGNCVRVKQMLKHTPNTRFEVFTYDLPWVHPKSTSIPLSLTLRAAYNRVVRRLPITDLLVCGEKPQSLVRTFAEDSKGAQLIQAENLWPTSVALAARTPNQPVIATLHDVYSDRLAELLDHFETNTQHKQRVVEAARRLEQQIIPKLDACVFVSQEDLERYSQLGVEPRRAKVIPNGVDTQTFHPLRDGSKYRSKYGLRDRPTVLFAGSDMYQNREAVEVIAQTLAEMDADCQLVVAGSISKYAHTLLKNRKIPAATLGYVESLQEVYAAADVVFAPMVSGTGTKLKILEAMACAKPVLTTPRGVRGLDVAQACVVAETPDLPERLGEMLSDSHLRVELGEKARAAAQKYDWRRLMPLYREVYHTLLPE